MTHPFLRDPGRPIVLASRSPRRAEILRAQGFDFTVQPAAIDETAEEGETAAECDFWPKTGRL